jgi:hypothetical protein
MTTYNQQTPNPLPPELLKYHNLLQTDLRFFCQKALQIKTKQGQLSPFIWNKAQAYCHEKIEEQKERTGMVRALILKGRQQGLSTYVAARYYHRATRFLSQSIFILSHMADTTSSLFKMVDRYHELCPDPIKPALKTNNNKRLEFDNMSQYTVGTAGSASIGRGSTNQCFHGSEVAFYENTGDIQTGVLQSVADLPGTEIILESTANGIGNFFHQKCLDALEGKGRYILIFIPWYWQDEYQETPPSIFELSAEEQQLQATYQLTNAQLYWRRLKIQDLRSAGESEWKFKQEYPMNVEEAFQSSGSPLISPERLAAAQNNPMTINQTTTTYPKILGVDPARKGDRTVIAMRQGPKMYDPTIYTTMDDMTLAGILARTIEEHSISKCFIDSTNGQGVADRLKELGFGQVVVPVHFSQRAMDNERFMNKRAEMALTFRDWFEDNVSMPSSPDITVDLLSVPDYKETSNSLIKLESKDIIKKTYGRSPDIFDAMMLTFAQPVRANNVRYLADGTATAIQRKRKPSVHTRNRTNK